MERLELMVSPDYSTEPGAAQVVPKDDTGPIVLYYVRSVDRGLSGPIVWQTDGLPVSSIRKVG